jgi:hypothetical protein
MTNSRSSAAETLSHSQPNGTLSRIKESEVTITVSAGVQTVPMSHAALMEKIMSKTNETSNLQYNDTLTDSELDAAIGGLVVQPKDMRDYVMIHYGQAVAAAATGK